MSFGNFLYKFNYNIRKIFRKHETTKKKIVKKQWSIIFVKRCLDINVQPKFYNIIYIIQAYIFTSTLVNLDVHNDIKLFHIHNKQLYLNTNIKDFFKNYENLIIIYICNSRNTLQFDRFHSTNIIIKFKFAVEILKA